MEELRTLLERHARPDWTTAVDGVLIGRSERANEPSASMSGVVLALIAQGAKTLALGDRVYEYRAGQYLVASVDLPVTGHYTEASRARPALGFGLRLDPSAIAELLLQAAPGDLARTDGGSPSAGGAPSALAVSDAPAELVDAAVRMLRLLDRPRDIPVLAPLIKREILWRLITGEQGAVVRQLGLADSSLSHVAHAVRWIRDNYRSAFRVEDVAKLAGMSVSAFYRNFQAVTAMSPIQFQKQIRLQQARLLLSTHPNDVTTVGHRVGYDSPSQFSREYRRQFGAPPSQDAARLRDTAPPAAQLVP
ncbi:AraC family transcriptional regulator N-terminal domain-containing protein [Dactylosporangium siamense]|uniref:AraC family transcriptional regulator n=1 Tax=Dactylosporangium siamense TaxID=685454 RepID=A0A919UEC6_9ACTN|nr:AraC family transcriptional regulator [Dactylosporangium siamense]GIG48490.1 AraC family transcriptional regulator [Dactylosporangium siamense]